MGRRGGGFTLQVREQFEGADLCLGVDVEPTESFWARIKEQTRTDDIVVGVCSRLSIWEEDKRMCILDSQLEASSHLQAPVLMVGFNHPDYCWRNNIARHKQSRMFLENN